MLFATAHQGLLFLWMMAGGMCIGIWYLLTAGLRRLIQAGFWLGLGCDLLFGAGAAVILTGFLISGNYGAVRPFMLLAALLGAALILFALSGPLRAIGGLFQRAGRRIVTQLAQNRLLKVIFK